MEHRVAGGESCSTADHRKNWNRDICSRQALEEVQSTSPRATAGGQGRVQTRLSGPGVTRPYQGLWVKNFGTSGLRPDGSI